MRRRLDSMERPNESFLLDGKNIKILKTIGRGASSTIRKGVLRIGIEEKYVAIKEIMLSRQFTKEKIFHEVKINFSAKHKHTIKVYGVFFSKEEDPYDEDEVDSDAVETANIVMEYCPEGDLDKYLDNHAEEISVFDRFNIVQQIAEGMCSLHSKDIVHRDLKPKNVLIKVVNGVICVKICDFGTSKTMQSIGNTYLGTPVYVCPSIVFPSKYKKCVLDDRKKVDVYSFAILTWQVLTGKTPFEECRKQNPMLYGLMNAIHMQKLRPSLEKLKSLKLPIQFLELVQRSWDENLSERPNFREIVESMKKMKMELPRQPAKRGKRAQKITREEVKVQLMSLLRETKIEMSEKQLVAKLQHLFKPSNSTQREKLARCVHTVLLQREFYPSVLDKNLYGLKCWLGPIVSDELSSEEDSISPTLNNPYSVHVTTFPTRVVKPKVEFKILRYSDSSSSSGNHPPTEVRTPPPVFTKSRLKSSSGAVESPAAEFMIPMWEDTEEDEEESSEEELSKFDVDTFNEDIFTLGKSVEFSRNVSVSTELSIVKSLQLEEKSKLGARAKKLAVVQFSSKSCFAINDSFYLEFEIMKAQSGTTVGLGMAPRKTGKVVGSSDGSFGYLNSGQVFDDGELTEVITKFSIKDRVGFGWNFKRKFVFYTHGGRFLGRIYQRDFVEDEKNREVPTVSIRGIATLRVIGNYEHFLVKSFKDLDQIDLNYTDEDSF